MEREIQHVNDAPRPNLGRVMRRLPLQKTLRFQPQQRVIALMFIAGLLVLTAALIASELGFSHTIVLAFSAAAATLIAISGFVGGWTLVQDNSHQPNSSGKILAELLETLPLASLITTPELKILEANRKTNTLPGRRTIQSLVERDLISPSELERLFKLAERVNKLKTSATETFTIDAKKWTIAGQPLPGDLLLWQIKAVAPVSEDQIDSAFPILKMDEAGEILALNSRATAVLGRGPKNWHQIVDEGDIPQHGSALTISTDFGQRTVFVADLPAPQDQHQIALIPLDPDNQEQSLAGKAWEGCENLPVPLLWLDAKGHVERVNRSAVQLIGDACNVGAFLGDLTEGLGRPFSDWLDEAIAGDKSNSPEFLRVTNSGRETFVQIILKPYVHEGETSLLAILGDATELKTLEAQFVQSQKMQAIGQLAGGVAHDFNNLLTAISGHCDLLLLRHDPGDSEYADLMQIGQNANRAAALVNQLLAFSRKQTLRPEEIDLRETISDLTHLLNRLVGEKVKLSFSHDPILSTIRADKRQLEQVLMNLVVNARDAIQGTGEIRLVTEGITFDTPQLHDRVTIPRGAYVSVKVIDTGIGIPSDNLSKVFEPFYTTKRLGEGTGLGLSTVYGIIKQTGGFIFAESTENEGTCFTLLFRATPDVPRPVQPKGNKQKANARHADGVILLVEDEAPVRAFASRALRLRGYKVLEASSGEEALEILEDSALIVDIFISDVIMPGMDGPTWVRQALSTRPDVRVIFVSGYAEESFGEDQARIPNSMFLPKPFSLTELTETVQNFS